ncbi:hypothetical protein KCTCHS21_11100 [Cohnella abietis]|uniref:Uncharacterized protein n=1 Tax=Cohnella abietis TaxID=2507935 RepID=A0A3T1D0X1_9BACL|nr:hypothetical protein KCTCHS21_11100 [Cohnella abietis]
MERDVRYFRATRSGEGTIRVRYTNISSNGVAKGHEWREMYEYFEQRGCEGREWREMYDIFE